MVLENATASDAPFSESLPGSNLDPYDTNQPYSPNAESSFVLVSPYPSPIYINVNDLPRRWSLLSQKPHPAALINGIKDSCRFATTVLQRPVTQDEANAFAYHFAKSVRIGSYGTPVGVTLGTVFALRSQKTYGFPFWSPFGKDGKSGRFSPDVFGPLKGQAAKAMWQGLRWSAYWTVGAIACQVFFGSYAISVSLAGRMVDPRLKEFTEALKNRVRDGHGREAIRREMEQGAVPSAGTETYDMARQRRSAQEISSRRSVQRGSRQPTDDASPTGGAFQNEYAEMPVADGFQSEEQATPQEPERQAQARRKSSQRDEGASRSSATQQSTNQGGSAWDRVRSEAISGSRTRSTRLSSLTPSSPSDSFSFSSEEQDQQLAKAEAQKQFDARIEREREGRDFDERRGRP